MNVDRSRDTSTRAAIRRIARRRRRALPAAERACMDRAICRHVEQLGAYRRARRVALFLAFDGEPSITRLVTAPSGRSKEFYAPVLRGAAMRFQVLSGFEHLRNNSFGIREPQSGVSINPRRLDIVLTPLVAYDHSGTRIGVGGGYYDRCFAFLRQRRHWLRPKLVGIAYGLQQVAELTREPWDVPLWGIVSEDGFRLSGGS